MKKILYSSIFVVLALFLGTSISHAQCEPDTVTCNTLLCPSSLPDGYIGQPYSEVITIIPPGLYLHPLAGEVEIVWIVVSNIKNMPPGISYKANADTLLPDSAYCVLLSGTPETADTFDLGITVSALVNSALLGGEIKIDSLPIDTTVSFIIHAGSGLDDPFYDEQMVICGPNPFNNTTTIRLKSQSVDDAELLVYNLLGGIVHREQMRTSPGINHFRFNGQDLSHGTYIYHITTKGEIYTNRLLKLKN